MAATPPPADRPRPATPTTPRARPPQRPHPRRWGRLLVLVLTVALVATLATRALADPDDGLPLGEAFDPQTQPPQPQPQIVTEAQQPTVADPSGTGSDDRAVISGPAQVLAGEEQPEPPVVVAQGQAERSGEGEPQQPLGGPPGCEGDGCAESLLDPGEREAEAEDDDVLLGMAAPRGGGGRRGRPPRQPTPPAAAADEPLSVDTRIRRLEQRIGVLGEEVEDPHIRLSHEAARLRAEAERLERNISDPQDLRGNLEHTLTNLRALERMELESDVRAQVEQVIRQAEEALATIGLPPTGHAWALFVDPRPPTSEELADIERSVNYVAEELRNPGGHRYEIADSYREMAEQVERRTDPSTAPEVVRRKVDFELGVIERMGSEVADNPEQQGKLAELKARAEELRQRLGNPMSMLDPEEVGLLVGPGFTLPPDLPTTLVTPATGPESPGPLVFTPSVPDLDPLIFKPPVLDPRPLILHASNTTGAAATQPAQAAQTTPEQAVNPGLGERINTMFEYAPKPDPTTTTIGVLGSGVAMAVLRALWMSHTGRLFLALPYMVNETLKANPMAPGPTQG